MVPVWGWGALLCMVLKAHHSPTQSLHRCSARSRGPGVIAQAFQHSARCSRAHADRHYGWQSSYLWGGEKWKRDGSWKVEKWAKSSWFYCWFVTQMLVYPVRKQQHFHCDQMSKSTRLCSGWCNGDMTWTESVWTKTRQWLFAGLTEIYLCHLYTELWLWIPVTS